MPAEFLVRKDGKCFRTSFSLTNVKDKDVSIRFFNKLWKDLFEICLIWVDNFGPTLPKKSLNVLHISSLSSITLEFAMILSNVFRLVFDLQIVSDMVCHVFLMSPLYWVNNLS